MRPEPAVLFQVFGAGGRGLRVARLEHGVPVAAVVGRARRGRDAAVVHHADGRRVAVVIRVGYDHGVGGTVRSVAIGPADQPQHNALESVVRGGVETPLEHGAVAVRKTRGGQQTARDRGRRLERKRLGGGGCGYDDARERARDGGRCRSRWTH